MERLTKRDTDGQVMMDCEKCKADWTGKHGQPMFDCTALYCRNRLKSRLAAYEDTGLEPGEVHSMWGEWNAMMSVLNSIGGGYERLRQLAEADKAGRAVILPCEPGTPVYMTFCGEVWEMRVGQFHVNGYTEPRIWADIDCDWASTQCVRWDLAVGKTVFLTREEAEKALEAMKK